MTANALGGVRMPGPDADGLPPLHVPMRFFVTAALFGVAAGLSWFAAGATSPMLRWMPATIAGTHLLTLGVLAMIACGALFQVVPVLGGGGLPQARLVASVVHPALTSGTVALAIGLQHLDRSWFLGALVLLAIAFGTMAAAVGVCLLRSRAPALRPLRLAMAGLLATVLLGGTMTAGFVWPELGVPVRDWTNVHATWGGCGFGLLLVVGVSQQVIPMFHVTAPFPRAVGSGVPWIVFAGLVALALPGAGSLGVVPVAVGGLWHVVVALRLLAKRRRRRRDATVSAWQLGLFAIAVSCALLLEEAVLAAEQRPSWWLPAFEVRLALLFGLGGIGTIVVGMLTKIVPFLAFLHLQRRAIGAPELALTMPTMDHFLSSRAASGLVTTHVVATGTMILAASWSAWAPAANLLLATDFAVLFVLLVRAARRYGVAVRRSSR